MKKWEERIREERRELAETLLSRREFIALSTLTQLNMLYKPSFNVSQAHSYFKFHWEHIWLFFIIGEANGEDVGKPTSYTDLSLVGCACNTHLWVLYYLFALTFTTILYFTMDFISSYFFIMACEFEPIHSNYDIVPVDQQSHVCFGRKRELMARVKWQWPELNYFMNMCTTNTN